MLTTKLATGKMTEVKKRKYVLMGVLEDSLLARPFFLRVATKPENPL